MSSKIKNYNKSSKFDFITYGVIVAAFIIVSLLSSQGILGPFASGTSCSRMLLYCNGDIAESYGRCAWRAFAWSCRIYECWSLYRHCCVDGPAELGSVCTGNGSESLC